MNYILYDEAPTIIFDRYNYELIITVNLTYKYGNTIAIAQLSN